MTAEFGAQQPLIEVDWHGHQPAWVRVAPDWAERSDPTALLTALSDEVSTLGTDANAWQDNLSLAGIPVEQWGRFNELIEAANAEAKANRSTPVTQSGRHWFATWSSGQQLLHLGVDREWMARVSLQELCETLTEAVQPPPREPSERPARDRFVAFLEGAR